MLGTAPPQTKILLIHQPGPWGSSGLTESRCDPVVARRIANAAVAGGMRLQAIRRPGKHETGTPAGGHDVGIADTATATIAWWRVDDLADIASELESGGPQRATAEIESAPLYLICAHGRHDACCALRGRPVAQAFEQVRPGRVWETTHLGGDRFAANMLVLPTGELYGRVPPVVAPDFVDRIDAGEVVPALMRGRIGAAPVAQAALIYAHQQLGIMNRDALVFRSLHQIDNQHWDVVIAAPHGNVSVSIVAETKAAEQRTCRSTKGATAREFRGVAIAEA